MMLDLALYLGLAVLALVFIGLARSVP